MRRAPRTPSVHTHVLCLLGITTRGNPTLTNSDAGDYELLFINTVSSFLVFTFAKKHFVLTKYSPVDESCPDEGEQAWPDCCPSGGRWPLLPIMAGIPTLPPTSLFFCPWSRQMICISCGMGSRQEAVTGVGGSLPGRSAPPGEPCLGTVLPRPYPSSSLMISYAQSASHTVFRSCCFHGRKQVLWRLQYFYLWEKGFRSETYACMYKHALPQPCVSFGEGEKNTQWIFFFFSASPSLV